ncbi:MAG: cytochrome C oxidase subunit IV family protein [Thermoanaerobaculia bacterium]
MEHVDSVQDADGHHDPEQIRQSMRRYLVIFGALALLTGVTVFVCFGLKLSRGPAIALALLIATIKGSLVAAFFMHLLSERKVIYALLLVTAAFFVLLMWLPLHDVIAKFHY